MQKYCFIFWDTEKIAEADRAIYIQCEECFKKSQEFKKDKKGVPWPCQLLIGSKNSIKCSLCSSTIYEKKKKKKKPPQEIDE